MRRDGPDFLSIGMQKSGTGWLYEQLGHHPDIWLPPVKELHYLNGSLRMQRIHKGLERLLERGLDRVNANRVAHNRWPLELRDLDFYKALAAMPKRKLDLARYCTLFAAKGEQISGDLTPAYCTLEPDRIAAVMRHLPHLKIILGIRDPVERFWSQVSQTVYMREKKEGEIVAYDDWQSIKDLLESETAQSRSFATKIAGAWRKFVPDEQFLLIFFDDLKQDPQTLRSRVLTFLGVDPQKFPEKILATQDSKASNPRVPMSNDIRERLVAYFADELRACAEIFGGPSKEWPKRHGLAG